MSSFRWLFALVAVSTACNFAYYALAFLWPWTREDNVRHLVRARQHRDIFYSSKKSDEAVVKFFANVGMQNDGTLLFWFIQSQANTIVARDTMTRIFDVYRYVRENEKPPPPEIAYDVLGSLPAATPKPNAPTPTETTSTDSGDSGNSSGNGFGNEGFGTNSGDAW